MGRLSDVEKGEGQQRGKVLTNATNLVVAFNAAYNSPLEAVRDIEKVARELYAVSKRLESVEKKGVGVVVNNEVNKAQQEAAVLADSVDEPNTPDVDW